MRSLFSALHVVVWIVCLSSCATPEPDEDGVLAVLPRVPDVFQVDRRVQSTTPVDLLFVVDASGSAAPEQRALADHAHLLLNELVEAGVDYHIGVATMERSGPEAGVLRRREVDGQLHRFVHSGMEDPDEVLSALMVPGVEDNSAEFGRTALYSLLETRRDNPRNEGFYREEASLHVVFVADEEDRSDSPSDFVFPRWFDGLKADPDRSAMHALVGPKDSCDDEPVDLEEYLGYVEDSGGVVADLCADEWPAFLEELGARDVPARQEFYLSRRPDLSAELEVWTEAEALGQTVRRSFEWCRSGQEVEPNHCEVIYDPVRNSMMFQEHIPESMTQVFVRYRLADSGQNSPEWGW